MFDASLMDTVAVVSGPALLTNASALLLGSASGRYAQAVQAQATSSRVDARVWLSAMAVHFLHLSLTAFGFDCALLLTAAALTGLDAWWRSALDTAATMISFVGLGCLTAGVCLLAVEGFIGVRARVRLER